jgi:hypothetical protein
MGCTPELRPTLYYFVHVVLLLLHVMYCIIFIFICDCVAGHLFSDATASV